MPVLATGLGQPAAASDLKILVPKSDSGDDGIGTFDVFFSVRRAIVHEYSLADCLLLAMPPCGTNAKHCTGWPGC